MDFFKNGVGWCVRHNQQATSDLNKSTSNKQQAGTGGPANHQAQPVVVFYVYIPPSPAAVQV